MGIDDLLMAAANAITLCNTLTEVIRNYKKQNSPPDARELLDDVANELRKRLQTADEALLAVDGELRRRNVDMNKPLTAAIGWAEFFPLTTSRRLRGIQDGLLALHRAAYSSIDDVVAIARCRKETAIVGGSAAEVASRKQDLWNNVLNAASVKESIAALRENIAYQLDRLG